MNHYEDGYCAQLRGVFKAHLLEGTDSAAQAYRAGARCCRADIAAEEEEADLDEALPPPASYLAPVADWARRLSEFRVMAGVADPGDWVCPGCRWKGPKDALVTTDTGIKDNCPKCRAFCNGPQVQRALAEIANGTKPPQSETKPPPDESKAPLSGSKTTPSAYAEPEPGARKPRKAKPVDDNQGTLFG